MKNYRLCVSKKARLSSQCNAYCSFFKWFISHLFIIHFSCFGNVNMFPVSIKPINRHLIDTDRHSQEAGPSLGKPKSVVVTYLNFMQQQKPTQTSEMVGFKGKTFNAGN